MLVKVFIAKINPKHPRALQYVFCANFVLLATNARKRLGTGCAGNGLGKPSKPDKAFLSPASANFSSQLNISCA